MLYKDQEIESRAHLMSRYTFRKVLFRKIFFCIVNQLS